MFLDYDDMYLDNNHGSIIVRDAKIWLILADINNLMNKLSIMPLKCLKMTN